MIFIHKFSNIWSIKLVLFNSSSNICYQSIYFTCRCWYIFFLKQNFIKVREVWTKVNYNLQLGIKVNYSSERESSTQQTLANHIINVALLAVKPDSSFDFDHMACLRITFFIDFFKTIFQMYLLNLEFVVINTKNSKTDSPHLEWPLNHCVLPCSPFLV
jgi:hypothetical protein